MMTWIFQHTEPFDPREGLISSPMLFGLQFLPGQEFQLPCVSSAGICFVEFVSANIAGLPLMKYTRINQFTKPFWGYPSPNLAKSCQHHAKSRPVPFRQNLFKKTYLSVSDFGIVHCVFFMFGVLLSKTASPFWGSSYIFINMCYNGVIKSDTAW